MLTAMDEDGNVRTSTLIVGVVVTLALIAGDLRHRATDASVQVPQLPTGSRLPNDLHRRPSAQSGSRRLRAPAPSDDSRLATLLQGTLINSPVEHASRPSCATEELGGGSRNLLATEPETRDCGHEARGAYEKRAYQDCDLNRAATPGC